MRVVRCSGAAGDVRSHTEVIQLLAPSGLLKASRCCLIFCAFRKHADQVCHCLPVAGLQLYSLTTLHSFEVHKQDI